MSVNPSQSWVTPNTALFGTGGSNSIPDPLSISTLTNVYSITGTLNTTASNVGYNPLKFTIRPDQASKGGQVWAQLEYDAVDTGANYALILGATNTSALIASVWPGFISMPLTLTGANVSLASDNETFLFCDGKEGAVGTISTGTQLLSASNIFNTITDPTKTYTADMTALLSTLQSVYPDCFR